MSEKEATARIKINKLLEAAGWRFFPEGNRPANICLELAVAVTAAISLSKLLARELAPHNILVNSVAPGSTLFPGGSWDKRQRENPAQIAQFIKDELPLGRFGRPEEVAAVVVFLASQQASLMTGACVTVDGCQSRSLI
ncbi:short-chain dehydrogenase [Candidatus Methylomirabilis lanthanidiphila]|uniref:Short-chain dehydrogenase n=1 Tax=Candidatus Methylomirabilis lanthanidiphila TaxID=2211376 RepID=A0A564ZER0_9BACT|nr:SDR family oxidoreductase [Candidatus Methylomirabilis lanthanidiphila]VUZ83809.1 short-chain dehydrogenase [Candidatus Methylomirabilis lanthanidiphila]